MLWPDDEGNRDYPENHEDYWLEGMPVEDEERDTDD